MTKPILTIHCWLILTLALWADPPPDGAMGSNPSSSPRADTNSQPSSPNPADVPTDIVTKKLFESPYCEDWARLMSANKLDQVQASFDVGLPDDVKTALLFIRSKLNAVAGTTQNILVIPSKNLLVVVTLQDFAYFIQVVPIANLNPADMTQRATPACLYLFTTSRKPVVTRIHPKDGLNHPDTWFVHVGGVVLLGPDEATNERIAKAASDIIVHYGGQAEETLSKAKTPDDWIRFIENKINKKPLSGQNPLPEPAPTTQVELDNANGEILFKSSDGKFSQTIVITGSKMHPDESHWDKSGNDASELSILADDTETILDPPLDNKTTLISKGASFGCANEQDAADVAEAFKDIAENYGWTPPKY